MQSYETVIGLEVHIQLNTKTKAFSSELNQFDLIPNQNISAVTLALPGTLPAANTVHVNKAVKLGLAFGCKINQINYFDRKNYFYPDLPKGYQITQDAQPVCKGGNITFKSGGKDVTIRIHHIHMEEDAGKSSHDQSDHYSLIDYNRAGTPLLELVTEPDFRSGQEVHDFLAYLQKVVQYLDVSDGNMEEGSIRCDCNVSVRPFGSDTYGERREIKNVNSKRFAKTAIEFESEEQVKIIQNGGTIYKTTMLFDPETGATRPMRKKETENDYRYFPEPDLPPVYISQALLEAIQKEIKWMPHTLAKELSERYNVPEQHIDLLTENLNVAEYFIQLAGKTDDTKELADLVVLKLLPMSQAAGKSLKELTTQDRIIGIISFIKSGKASKAAIYQSLVSLAIEQPEVCVTELAERLDLLKSDDQDFLDDIIIKVMNEFPDKVKEYKGGKKGLIGFFIGQVKKEAGNKADPQTLNEKLITALN